MTMPANEPSPIERIEELARKPIEPKPPIARQHCRHYSYVLPYSDPNYGPHCAVGVDLSAPCSTGPCMPNGTGCEKREDWTDEERARWEEWQQAGQERMIAAIKAIPSLEPRQRTVIHCPNCGGLLTAERTKRRAYVNCETEHCVQFEAALGEGLWPARAQPSPKDSE